MKAANCPNCAWAIEAARNHKLPTAQRIMFITIAERVSRHTLAWKGTVSAIMDDTGLSRRTIQYVLNKGLLPSGLISVARDGCRYVFTILRQKGAATAPLEGATIAPLDAALEPSEPHEGAITAPLEAQKGATTALSPLKEESPKGRKEGRGARAARRHPTPLPEAWQPSVAACDLGHSLGLSQADVAMAADRMRDWSIGDGKLKADWDATFRNWLRKDASEPRRRPEHAMSKHEQIRRAGNLGTFLSPLPYEETFEHPPQGSFLRVVS